MAKRLAGAVGVEPTLAASKTAAFVNRLATPLFLFGLRVYCPQLNPPTLLRLTIANSIITHLL